MARHGVGHHRRCLGPHPDRPDHARLPVRGRAREAALGGPELRHGRGVAVRARGRNRPARPVRGQRASQRGVAERTRAVRRKPPLHGRSHIEGRPRARRRKRARCGPQHRGRLLRQHAGPYPRHRARARRRARAGVRGAEGSHNAPLGPGSVRPRAGQPVLQRGRAHQCRRFAQIRAPDTRRRPVGGRGHRARPGRGRRPGHRREHGRCVARFDEGDGSLPGSGRHRARHSAGARDGGFIQLGHRAGGAEAPAGQGHPELHQPEGRRGCVPGSRGDRVAPGRRRGGDGFRRKGPGGQPRAQDRDMRTRLPPAGGLGRHAARGHHPGPEHFRRGHRA